MKTLICILATMITSTALAYKDGTYNCKVTGSTIDRVIKIDTISLASGISVPHVKITRPFQQGQEVTLVEVEGLATVHKTGKNQESLMLAALRLDFVKDELQSCRQQ